MSATIDKTIVEMQFDNKQFENGVDTSLSSMEKLKKSLQFDKAVDVFGNLSKGASRVDLTPIENGLNNLNNKFSAFGIATMAVFANIANSAFEFGKRIVSSLTIDPIMTGMNEYETKLNSIQTILANTQGENTNIDTVTKALNELNEYSDKTIYNFQEMARNVGTFTAAGVKLQTSVDAIKGIANLAAVSGSNAQQASTAMYQLSQALATGTVKLMDWNSVVNAGMGGKVFQDALKETARVHGIAIDQIIADEGSFRDSLQKGWLTSQILTETLSKFTGDLNADQLRTMGYSETQIESILKLGKTANDAATKVKTFTQLFDTLKEAAQSGWALSWEAVIGNFEEARTFLTEINNIIGGLIGSSADARNKILYSWKELGGRADLLESVRNIFADIGSVVRPISEAMREIFPPVTVEQLLKLTAGLKEFTKTLILSEEQSGQVKRIFKGIFALFDILSYSVNFLVTKFVDLVKVFSPTISSFSEFLAKIGDFIVSIRDAIKKGDGFVELFQKLSDVLYTVGDGFKYFYNKIIDAFGSFSGVSLEGIKNFISNMKDKFRPLSAISDFFIKIAEFISLLIKKLTPIVLKLSDMISSTMGSIGTLIMDNLSSFKPERVIAILNSGLFSAILLAVKNFISKGSSVFGGVSDILDSVKGSLEAWQTSLKSDVLLKIAAALGIMTLSIFLLATIDKEKLASALTGMTVMFVQLGVALSAFEKISASANPMQMTTMATGLIGIALAMLIMSESIRKLGQMDAKELVKGTIGVTAMIGLFKLASKVLSESSAQMITGAVALTIFSFAIGQLTNSIVTISKLDVKGLSRGLIGIGVLLTELSLFMRATNLGGMGLQMSLGMLIIAGAITILVKAVETLSNISGEGLARALAGLAGLLTEISLFMYATAGGTTLVLTAAGIAVMAVAMLGLTSVMERLGALSWEEIARGLVAMAGALVLMGAASYLLPPTMITQAAGMIVMAGSLILLAQAMKMMGSMSWDEVGRGLAVLAGSLLILSVALYALTGSIGGAAALIVASAGLVALATAMKIMGSMSWEELLRGLVGLAAVLVILGVAGAVMTPVVPTLLLLGAAMLLIGAGAALAGIGLLAFSAGLTALAASGAAGAAALVVVISSIVGLVPMLVATLGRAILELVDVLVEGAPKLLSGIVALLTILLDGLIVIAPKLVEFVINLIEKLLVALADKMPTIVQAGYDILKGLLQGIYANIGDVINLSIDIINVYLTTLASRIPDIVDSGWNLIIAWINGMKDGIDAHLPELIAAVQDLGIAIVKGIVTGLIGGRNKAVDAIKEIANAIISEFKYVLGINSPSTIFSGFGLNLIDGLVNGIKNNLSQVISIVKNLSSSIVNQLKTDTNQMISIGSNFVSGFSLGIKKAIGEVINSAKELATQAINAIKTTLGIQSPSTVMYGFGKNTVMGFANGITKFKGLVVSSIDELGTNAIDEMSSIISEITNAFDNNMDTAPTIKPVLDISEIQNGSKNLGRIFGNQSLALKGNLNKVNSINLGENSNNEADRISHPESPKGDIKFIQYNNSPKALSPIEVYRQTKNLLSRTQQVTGAI